MSGAGYEAILNHDKTQFAGSVRNGIKIWNIPADLATAAPTQQGSDLSVNEVSHTAFNHDGTRLVSGSINTNAADSNIKIWDISLSTPSVLHDLEHGGIVFAVDFSSNGRMVASGGADNNIKIWNASDRRSLIRTIDWSYSALSIRSPFRLLTEQPPDCQRLRRRYGFACGDVVGPGTQIAGSVDPTDPSDIIDLYRASIESGPLFPPI